MNNSPLVSILIPVYNVEAYLRECLDSVLGQTYGNLQVVLTDDGSKDGSWDVMREYAAKDSRVEIYHQENQGVASTRNHLLEKVKGEYVLFVDSDDWIESDMVEFLLHKLVDNEADVSMCGNVINDAPVRPEYTEKIYDRETTVREFLFHNELRGSLWNKLVRTSLLHNVKFHCGISYGEDALFCWYFFQNVEKLVFTDRQLYHYRMVDNSLCHSRFGPQKLSAHYAWEQICNEVGQRCPQYLHIAQARHCIEDTLLLRDALKDGYTNRQQITMLRKSVEALRQTLYRSNITTMKMKLYTLLLCHSYALAKLF